MRVTIQRLIERFFRHVRVHLLGSGHLSEDVLGFTVYLGVILEVLQPLLH